MNRDPLMQYLLKNSRPMTEEERETYRKAIEKISTPTGINLFAKSGKIK